jgi:tetratricopeptide (TPR) repeat protein
MTPVPQLLELALQHYRRGELQQAEQIYLRVLEVDPHQVEALRIIALVFCRTGRSERAIEYLRAVLRLRPAWADAHNDLGMVQISLKRLADATASFREAVRLQPGLAAAHNNLGSALREAGRPDEAVGCLQEAVRLVPRYAEAHYNLGLALADQQKLVDSLTRFQEAVSLKAEYVEAHLQIGTVLGRLGRHAEAVASLQEVLRLQPGNPYARTQLALAHLKTEDHRASESHRQEALDVGADQAKAIVSPKDATEPSKPLEVGKSNQEPPNGSLVFIQVPDRAGPDLCSPRSLDDSQASLREALHLISDHARLHFYLASVLERQGRTESALAHYEQVTRLEPDHAQAHLRIATIRKVLGGVDDQINAGCNSLPPRASDEHVRNSSLVTKNGKDRRSTRTIEEQYARWERGSDQASVEGVMWPKDERQKDSQGKAEIGGAAVLDVFFGLDANASQGEADQFVHQRLSEWISDRAAPLGESDDTTVPPHSAAVPSHNGTGT